LIGAGNYKKKRIIGTVHAKRLRGASYAGTTARQACMWYGIIDEIARITSSTSNRRVTNRTIR
jgi:hypothetical protein